MESNIATKNLMIVRIFEPDPTTSYRGFVSGQADRTEREGGLCRFQAMREDTEPDISVGSERV